MGHINFLVNNGIYLVGVAFPALVFSVLLSHELHMYIAQWLKGKSPKTLNQRILPKMHLQKYYIHFR